MSISTKCPDCDWLGKVNDVLQGKKIKCPRCGAVIRVSNEGLIHLVEKPSPMVEDHVATKVASGKGSGWYIVLIVLAAVGTPAVCAAAVSPSSG